MKITDVEAIVLRRHDPVRDISDGTQDTLIVRIHTDAGLVGIGEVDSAPEVVRAAIEAPKSHLTCSGFRQLLLGEDPRDVGRLVDPRFWIDGDGMVAVPQDPGLGITLDEQVLERYRVA